MIRHSHRRLRDSRRQTVSVAGWVQALRLQRAMQFVIVRDHTGTVQVTHRRDGARSKRCLTALTTESAVRITGGSRTTPWYRSAALSSFRRR